MKNNKKAQTAILILCVAVLSILVIAGIYRCPIYAIFGIPCPGCGMTRAFLSLIRGNINASFAFHPLAIPLLLFAVYVIITGMLCKSKKPFSLKFLWAFIIIFIAVYIIRMILLFPHTEPLTFNGNALLPRLISYVRKLII